MSDEDFDVRAQRVAEEHLAACVEACCAADELAHQDPSTWPESPAVGPFCGCDTCVVREVLHAAWPILLDAARADKAAEREQALEALGTARDCMFYAPGSSWKTEGLDAIERAIGLLRSTDD